MIDSGKHFIVGLKSTKLELDEIEQIKELQPLGFIFFNRNFDSTPNWQNSFNDLVCNLRSLVKRKNIILSIDHEGGRVNRLPKPVTTFPYAQDYANFAKEVANVFAKELTSLGFNLCYAPVLDIDLEPSNKVISKRAFSSKCEEVTNFAIKFADELESNGILSCGKHFPGHGATVADSHFELPVNNSNLNELTSLEILPFKAYIDKGFNLIMSSHILFPKIDNEFPATLSTKIIKGILREKLAYNSCVITDDLDMKALDRYPQKATKAIKAGIDILLIGGIGESTALSTALEMKKEIENCDLSESSKRIDNLLDKIDKLPKLNFKTEDIGNPEHQLLAKQFCE